MSGISEKALRAAREAVIREFPEMRDVEPSIRDRRGRVGGREVSLYQLSFCKKLPLEGGGYLTQRVQVTTDEEGNILKMLSSKGRR